MREGKFDALIGVNLLREGLDLPEVSLVIVVDADKEGFLRSTTSLIQTIGRCARNAQGRVIFYADTITPSMQKTIDETDRRRKMQLAYNKENNITPQTVTRAIETGLEEFFGNKEEVYIPALDATSESTDREAEIKLLEEEMIKAADEMRFEDAAALRDRLLELKAPINYTKNEAGNYGRKPRRRKTKKRRTKRKKIVVLKNT